MVVHLAQWLLLALPRDTELGQVFQQVGIVRSEAQKQHDDASWLQLLLKVGDIGGLPW